MRKFWGVLAIALVSAVLVSNAFAQGAQTGGISGVVHDPSGAVLVGAKVQITNEQTGAVERSLVTGADGSYVATLLRPGPYRIDINASGFKHFRANSVMVRLAETTRLDARLDVGGAQEVVSVEAVNTLVNTEAATTGQPIDTKTIAALPLPTPNFLFLLSLSAGTAGEPGDVRTAGRGTQDINVNGQRTTNNSYNLEGVNVNDFNRAHFDFSPLPNPEVIQEFKVATSLYDATSGSKGGGALAVSIKPGTKDWHWVTYWQNRNDAFNATEWFTKFNSPGCTEFTLSDPKCKKGRLAQNVTGGSISGPVKGLGGVFFANYQALRARNGIDPAGSQSNPTVPWFPTNADGSTSAALLASAYSLSPSAIDPVAVNVLNVKNTYWGGTYAIPRPGQAGCNTPSKLSSGGTMRCSFSRIAELGDDQFTISYDRPLRAEKDSLKVRWFYDDFSAFLPFGLGGSLSYPTTNPNHNKFLSLGYTTQISNRQINDFRFGFSRFHFLQQPQGLISLGDIGATRPNMAEIPDMYQISLSGLFSLGIGANDDQGVVANTYYWSDTWAKAFNRHTLRAGTEISRYQLNRFNRFVQRGVVTLGSTSGSGGCPPACTAFQDFLLGRATSLQVGGGDPSRYFRAKDVAFFVQDDLRVNSRLTVNLGLRWEGMGYTNEVFNRMATYDINLALAGKNPFAFPEDLNFQGFTGNGNKIPDCMIAKCFDTNNWAPRVGFALDLLGDKKTVLRGGYGIYYQRISNQTVLQTSLAPPFTVQAIDSRPDGNPGGILAAPWVSFPALVPPQLSRFAGLMLSGTNTPTTNANDPNAVPVFVNDAGQRCIGYPSNVTGASNCAISTASFTVPPQGFYTPYNQQWNLTVQRELLRGWALEMGYLGAHYVGGLGIYNPYVRLASPSSPITVQDINGASYTITTNTVNNEPLRFQALGLSRNKGARFAGNIGWALYHSGQVTVSHRFEKGLFFQAGYTWSKTLDNVSGSMGGDELNVTRNGQGGANLFNLGNLNPALNKALGDFDRPHRLVVSYSYDLPLPKNGIWGSQAFQGWSLSGITYFQSGLPFSITDPTGGGAYGSGGSSSPMLICSNALAKALPTSTVPTCTAGAPTTVQQAIMPGDVQQNVNFYLNPNMFSANTTAPFSAGSGATTYGNVPRNAFRGPFQQSWDMSISKRFRITEKDRLSFRADFFNAFNHPVFRASNTVSVGTPTTMGQITNTAVPARLIQFGLKYEH